MSKQTQLSEYTLPEMVQNGNFRNEENVEGGPADKIENNSNWIVICGKCGAGMRGGVVATGWDGSSDKTPLKKDLFTCRACNRGSVHVGYFEVDKSTIEVAMSENGAEGGNHKFMKFDPNHVRSFEPEDDDDEGEVIVPADSDFNLEGWEEP